MKGSEQRLNEEGRGQKGAPGGALSTIEVLRKSKIQAPGQDVLSTVQDHQEAVSDSSWSGPRAGYARKTDFLGIPRELCTIWGPFCP